MTTQYHKLQLLELFPNKKPLFDAPKTRMVIF